jgi:exopolysaccharide biosynthesis polyprenyl glycosylphosphotransferase
VTETEIGLNVKAAARKARVPSGTLAHVAKHGAWWRDALRRRFLAVADLTSVLLGAAVLGLLTTADIAFWWACLAPVWILLAKVHGLYDRDHRALRHLTTDEIPPLVSWVTAGTIAGALVFEALAEAPALSALIWTWALVTLSAFLLRGVARWVWRRVTPAERTLIVGDGPLSEATRRKLELFPDIHAVVVGSAEISSGEWRDVERLAEIDRVILASSSIDENDIRTLVASCRRHGVKLTIIPPARGMFGTAVQLRHIAELPVIEYNTWDVSRSTLLIKRAVDVALSSVALILFAPVGFVIAVAIRSGSAGPAIFTQTRAGADGRPFRMYKFRTMVCDAEDLLADLVPFDRLSEPVFKLQNDPRVTRIGRFLRRTSLDELPQLLNILKGEMSLVGPRPEQVELVDRYTPGQRIRLAVKPGLTGPMQVYGRGELCFEERVAVERDYIENYSLWRDFHILAMTFSTVVRRNGAF